MSVDITITLPDGYVERVLDNFAEAFNWTHPDGYGSDGYYDEKADFLKDKLVDYTKDCVRTNEVQSTVTQAQIDLESAKIALAEARQGDYLDPVDIT